MKKTAYIFIFLMSLSPAAFGARATDIIQSVDTQMQQETVRVESITRPAVTYSAEGLRDPFAAGLSEEKVKIGAETKKELPEFKVQGVIWGTSIPQAIINNKVVKAGDSVEDARVLSIDKSGITILFGGAEYVLSSPAGGASSAPEEE